MEIRFRNRVVKVRASFDLEDVPTLILVDGSRFMATMLRVAWAGESGTSWHLEGRKFRKDGTLSTRDTMVFKHDFLYTTKDGYQIPEWVTETIAEHTPKTLDI